MPAREELKRLQRENRELKKANEILRLAWSIFCEGGARPPTEVTVAFIDDYRQALGVEPVCRAMQIAPSTYYQHKAYQVDPDLRSPRRKRDEELQSAIQRVRDDNFKVYGTRKVWRQLAREGFPVGQGAPLSD
jgi:putative transposase